MCGICGFNWKDEKLIAEVTNQMVHRGPDQFGHYCDENVSLGHRRLSIIDLSENGRQPMCNEDGSVQMVFNGEIYNFQELREKLEPKHTFKSRADSEVIVHAYEEYGLDAVNHLRGMFAFAIWDSAKKRLFLARDRIGIKPLYYYNRNGRFAFASEMKSLLRIPQVEKELNLQAIYDYLGFEFVPAPETMCKDVFKVPAGHMVVVEDGGATTKQYWDMHFTPQEKPLSYGEAVEKEREMLDYVVKSHMISDVPLGVFLSGGLDSSTLVALMRRHISGPLRTFTIGFPDKTFSELDYAKIVSDTFETEHHVLMIDSVSNEEIEKVLWHLDEPMTDLSTIPLYLICKKAREHVTVCLSGEGGDESFAGYDRFKASKANSVYGMIPGFIRDPIIKNVVGMLPDQAQKKGAINIIKRFVQGSCLPPEAGHLRWQYFSSEELDNALYSGNLRDSVDRDPFRKIREYAAKCDATERINEEIYLDMRFMMTDSVLMKVDKMSMAHSLEVRVPLLDHVFVEYIASLPGDWKLKGYQTKGVLRSALEGILPHDIVYRGKQGYSLPVKNLLRDQLKDYMTDLLNDSPVIKENMNMNTVNRLISEHLSMKQNHNHTLWGLVNIAAWYKNTFLQ